MSAIDADGPVSPDEWVLQDHIDLAATRFPADGNIGDERILIFKIGEGYRGVQQRCPHQNVVLLKASIVGGRRIKCPLHNFIFELKDGRAVNCPPLRLRVFDVREQDGKLSARASPT